MKTTADFPAPSAVPRRALAVLAGVVMFLPLAAGAQTPVNWGGAGAVATAGVLESPMVPPVGTYTFSNVIGQGYDLTITTSSLNNGGEASYFGDPGWWFEGRTSGYGTVTVRFYVTGTSTPVTRSDINFRLRDAETNERFRSFGYYDAANTLQSIGFDNVILSFSHTPLYHVTDQSYENTAPQAGGDQAGKWIEINLTGIPVSGFTLQAFRKTASAGSVIMSDLVSPWSAWRTANFGGPPFPVTADDLANPDGDAPLNIFEYFYGTDPNVADAPDPAQLSVIAGRLALTFPRDSAATDATATVQGADSATGPWADLARSVNGGVFTALPHPDGPAMVTETGAGPIFSVEVRDLYLIGDPMHPTRFLRLQVAH